MIGFIILVGFLLCVAGYALLRNGFNRWWKEWERKRSVDYDDGMMLPPPPVGWRNDKQ